MILGLTQSQNQDKLFCIVNIRDKNVTPTP